MGTPGNKTLPADGSLTPSPTQTVGDMQTDLENWLSGTRMMLGGGVDSKTISSGSITPVLPIVKVDTEGAAASDDLDFMVQTNYTEEGRVVALLAANDARTVVVRHNITGSGKFLLANSVNFSLDTDKKVLLVRKEGTTWVEVGRFFGADGTALRTFFGYGNVVSFDASATPGNDLVVVANGSGKLADGWVQKSNVVQHESLVLLEERAVNGPELFSSLLNLSAYRSYLVEIEAFTPGSDDVDLILQASINNGSSFLGGSPYNYSSWCHNQSGSTRQNASAGNTSLVLTGGATGWRLGTGLAEFCSGQLRIHAISGLLAQFTWSFCLFSSSPVLVSIQGSGFANIGADDMDAFQLTTSSGSPANGFIRVYGQRKSV